MISNCSDGAAWRLRLLAALADECARLGTDIARLGAEVGDGRAGRVALQAFDTHAQAAQSLGRLLNHLHGDTGMMRTHLVRVPLPHMRARLLAAMDGVPMPVAETSADMVIWQEAQ